MHRCGQGAVRYIQGRSGMLSAHIAHREGHVWTGTVEYAQGWSGKHRGGEVGTGAVGIHRGDQECTGAVR
jgi:hypothetical protein